MPILRNTPYFWLSYGYEECPAVDDRLRCRGHVSPKGLLELGVAGNVAGIPLPNGSQGGLAANLVTNVDLSGQP